MSRLVAGVIGHVDHGKTALVKALTGQDTDRLPEEKARGISIALGFAHFEEGGVAVDLIDMPGHERFVRTMISGATGIDAVLLVVAANEGIKPQTVEHVEIAGLLGLRQALVAVTKCDLVDDDAAELAGAEAVELLAANGLNGFAMRVTAPRGEGVEALRIALAGLVSGARAHPASGLGYFPIDRAFSMPGQGPVVTGTLRGAALSPGQVLELHPLRRQVRLRGLQVHGQGVERAEPGQRVALNLRGVGIGELHRGMALTTPGMLEPSEWLTIWLRALGSAPAIRNGARVQALFGASEGAARVRLLDRDVLAPGECCFAQLRFDEDVVVPAGEHVVLRRQATVAGGRVLEPRTRRLKRNDAALLQRLEKLRDLPSAGLLAVLNAEPAKPRRALSLRPDPRREAAIAARMEEIAAALLHAGLTPPLPREIGADPERHRAVERLLREGVLLRCHDRDKDKVLLFHSQAVDRARRILAPLLAEGDGLTVSEIAAALGVSRKFVMPLLDHFDTVRFTRRVGDRRVAG